MLTKLFRLNKKKQSASIAKERLQIIVAHQRNKLHYKSFKINSYLITELKNEIIKVLKKYMFLSEDNIKDINLKVENNNKQSIIELNIPFN